MTLGCLAPYRRLCIGTVMLKHVLDICEKDGNIDSVFLHVQVSNEGAIKFYEKHGFTIAEEKKNYYKRIEPADAYLLQKSFKEPRAVTSTAGSELEPSVATPNSKH
ncbi:N-alpha-acetyltransferase 50 [Plakobranchus ocellatus]|uniref:N-terminal methionine N(alpha)-acetyltransferase NatE n=1 Tax=Plakobranchus ocellatus TaxID=259542 RepID=A0AAV4CEP5_9GAST|nr:N-alpha-acetyltransferase 50 [Plakobranchus ocellatus]